MTKSGILILILSLWCQAHIAWQTPKVKVEWITIEELPAKLASEQRPVLIDLYTDWCGWCKVMDKKTYAHPSVAAYLNRKFYNVKFNAESTAPVQWKGKMYKYSPRYRTHELAIALTGGELAYPTTIFLGSYNDAPQAIPGYLEVADMEKLATYFGEGKYRQMPFDVYAKGYKTNWK